MINWNVTKEENDVIHKIAGRAKVMIMENDSELSGRRRRDRRKIEMDITATHLNGCPLKLDDLLAADASDFCHDVFGIARFLDRETGKLGSYFVPRFAA